MPAVGLDEDMKEFMIDYHLTYTIWLETKGSNYLSTGAGELSEMLAASASLLNVEMLFLGTGDQVPAEQAPSSKEDVDGSSSDSAKIRELASKVDVLAIATDRVNPKILEDIEKEGRVSVQPSSATIRITQDKYMQKEHLISRGVRVMDSTQVEPTAEAIQLAGRALGYPFILKGRKPVHYGPKNFIVRSEAQVSEALKVLEHCPLYAERWASFTKELAIVVVRAMDGQNSSYPAVEVVHKNDISHLIVAPLRGVEAEVLAAAKDLAETAVQGLTGAGAFSVKIFLMTDGGLVVNSITSGPRDCGNFTVEACYSSQYDNHLRAILSLPLGTTELKVPSAITLNLIGQTSDGEEIARAARAALSVHGATTHLYRKPAGGLGRKKGHVTIVGDSDAQTRQSLGELLRELGESAEDVSLYAPAQSTSGIPHSFPLVGIIMGSDTDLPVMRTAAAILESLDVPFELGIVSAHRTVDYMVSYAKSAATRGLRVIIAGAGGAAHLPGMVASMTSLPVIGVPVKASSLDGVDSLHSIVQMPRGVPVATVGINNSTNAALLAVRILGASEGRFRIAMDRYLHNMENEQLAKVDRLKTVGWKAY